MTLIVARKYKNNFIIVGDTKITDPFFDKNNPKDGLIKSVIINSQLCISISGNIIFGEEALQEIVDGMQKENIIERLKYFHEKSENKTSFLVCFGNPYFEMIIIKDGIIENGQNGWIGSFPAFKKFQNHFHSQKKEIETTRGTFFEIALLPDEFDEKGTKEYSSMFSSMNAVIEDSEIPEVGGFIIPIVYEKNRFEYMGYCHTYRKTIDIAAESSNQEWTTIKLLGAEEGSYCVNFSGSLFSRTALYFPLGQFGILYERHLNKLLSPEIIPNIDEIDFADYIKKTI